MKPITIIVIAIVQQLSVGLKQPWVSKKAVFRKLGRRSAPATREENGEVHEERDETWDVKNVKTQKLCLKTFFLFLNPNS